MTINGQNIQWPSGSPYIVADRGTLAIGVKEVVQPIPDTIVAAENFETSPITGSGTWFLDTTLPHTGLRYLRSAIIGNNASTIYTFPVPATSTVLRFWYRISSELNFDFLKVYKNSILPANVLFSTSGTANVWTQLSLSLVGVTSVIFEYSKDSSSSAGLDLAAIDDLEWIIPGVAAVTNYEPLHLDASNNLKITVGNFPAVAHLNCATDSVTICSGVTPIDVIVSNFPATVALDAATLAALETITVLQGTSPWVVSGTVNIGTMPEVEIKNDSGNPIPVSGTVALDASTLAALETITVLQGTSPWVVSGTVDIGTMPEVEIKNDSGNPIPVSGTVTVLQGTSPWVVSGTVNIGTMPEVEIKNDTGNPIPVTGTVTITDGSGPITVDGTVALDASTLAALETITVLQGTSPWVVSGTVNIGTMPEVEIKNDIGNPIPVIGTVALDAPTLAALETITVLQGTSPWVVSGTVNIGTIPEVEIKNDSGNPIPVTGTVTITDGSGPITVDGTVALDAGTITALTGGSGTLNNGLQVTVTGSATSLVAANANRRKLIIQNIGLNPARIGTTGVTATTGMTLPAGGTVIFDMPSCPTNDIFAIRDGLVNTTILVQEIVA
jgi:hypothetical protein